ncbi:MAG: hypothetical protein K0Q90_517 [Paenibacillaceae bacterium]|jgi:hypothetical protein|nr:hypothetical protein [Paenibacillaceae bacterium]
MGSPLEINEDWLERIRQSVNGLEFGNVQIIVHGGRIVQIERTERKRFEGESGSSGGASASVPVLQQPRQQRKVQGRHD